MSQSAPSSFAVVRRFVERFRDIVYAERGLMLGSLGALFAEVAFRLLEPWPIKYLIDDVLMPSLGPSPASPALQLVVVACVAVVLFASMRALASYLSTVGFALAGNRILVKVRERLYQHLQALPLTFHHRARQGDLVVRVMSDVGLLKDVAVTAALPLIGNIFVLGAMVGVMAWINLRLTLVAILVAPLVLLTARRQSQKIRVVAKEQRKRESNLATITSETLGAIGTVQSLSLGQTLQAAFASSSATDLSAGVRGKRLAAGLERSVDVMIAFATAAVLGMGVLYVLGATLSMGELIVFLAYLKSAFKPLRNWAKYTGRLAKASAAAERVLEVMDDRSGAKDAAGAVIAPRLTGEIELRHLSFAYPDGRSVFADANLYIGAGQRIAILGDSGAGKSTLFSLLSRLHDPDAGTLLLDRQDARSFTIDSLRSQITVLLQRPTLFAASIETNIAYGAVQQGVERAGIEAAAKQADIHDFIVSLPDGYDTELGERGLTLSVGQRQRIAIARAILRDAPILIFDEPTVGLDAHSEARVLQVLQKLARGKTCLMATHDWQQLGGVDRVFAIEQGVFVDRTAQVLSQITSYRGKAIGA